MTSPGSTVWCVVRRLLVDLYVQWSSHHKHAHENQCVLDSNLKVGGGSGMSAHTPSLTNVLEQPNGDTAQGRAQRKIQICSRQHTTNNEERTTFLKVTIFIGIFGEVARVCDPMQGRARQTRHFCPCLQTSCTSTFLHTRSEQCELYRGTDTTFWHLTTIHLSLKLYNISL